jgi:hypothetical protein
VRVPTNLPPHTLAIVDRCTAFYPLLLPGQFFSHTTAALLWRLPLPRALQLWDAQAAATHQLHVSSTTRDRPKRKGIVGHRVLPGHPVVRRFGLPTSDAPTTFLAMAPLVGLDDLIVMGDALVRTLHMQDYADPRPFTTIAELERFIAQSSGRGVRKAAAALGEVRVGSESPPETLLRLLLVRAGIPEPELNINVYDRNEKWLGRADQVWPEWRTITEYDGEQHRTDAAQYATDERRIEDFVHDGWHVVRVRKSGLTPREQSDTIERVKRALRAGGWRG